MALTQLLISGGIFLAMLLALIISNIYMNKIGSKRNIKKKTTMLAKRSLNLSIVLLAGTSIAFVMGINLQNVWVAVTGIIAIIAIGFFAVWSILSNVIAGLILFFSRNFNLGETIEIFPEKIKGRVENIHSMFTVIEDKKGNKINIPNNLILQRIVKRYKLI